jgi:hypothetical protein
MIPVLMTIRIRTPQSKGFALWLPIVLLWPFWAILFVLIAPFATLAQIVLIPYKIRPLSMMFALTNLICQTRGMRIDVSSQKAIHPALVKISII